jgi:hypothetical protein
MDQIAGSPTRLSDSWIGRIATELRRLWNEKQTARELSRDCLRLYQEVGEAAPQLPAYERYREVVARQTGLDEDSVRRILEGATTSYAQWPHDRDLQFRDVVQYLVALRCLDGEAGAEGIRSRLESVIREEIPAEL